ncbi:DegT/DnrJ/EryC1/StrS aminotransferase [Candidatus Terasakiella magnetica]|uniref:DegT/DnrJ/EryC1/StrS aminotransferase n=1 Tax=Candidatus Terasakiella magnetica TaxID=1867952 RepID=A0A1C3RKX4_9PROT|nr:UDP-4-amino-4,6-dideoxy-N-acetyl-beta-L-altrosamine transaminase [Candidatus Terasakiella magnetica]SCA57881.1 DegT/DnrJ/EryC1/StrS aminotransferase [Candidatus Terasakiella magnetica]
MSFKPYARPDVRESDIDAVVDVLKSQFLTTGPKVPELEKQFTALVQAKEAVACSNGTTALHLASLAIGLKPGDKVVVPALTFLATANAVRMCGADVVFCDVDPDTAIMTLENLKAAEEKAGEGIVAIYPVHIGGHCADMKSLSDYARSKGWKIVEDACHALGGTNQAYPVGACAYSDLACFSLHATKSFTSCEGGMVTTNDAQMAERMRILRNHGMLRDEKTGPWAYEMNELGYNHRLSDVHAALAICQLSRLQEVGQRRMEIVQKYREELDGLSPYIKSVSPTENGEPLLHLFQLLIDFDKLGKKRPEVCKALMEKGVGTQVHYIPVANQPYYVELYGEPNLPGAQLFYERVLALPLYSSLSEAEVNEVISAVKDVLL